MTVKKEESKRHTELSVEHAAEGEQRLPYEQPRILSEPLFESVAASILNDPLDPFCNEFPS